MKYSDLLKHKDSGDLQALMDALVIYISRIPKVERPGGELGTLVHNVLSYRNQIDSLFEEEINILWKTVKYLLDELADIDPDDILDDLHTVANPNALESGLYWIFPGSGGFISCRDHKKFVNHHQSLFVERLGLDGWELMRAKHSSLIDPTALALAAGAIRCRIDAAGKRKKAYYQLCQESLSWLKSKIASMPIKRNTLRVWDPAKPFGGWKSGILFILKK